MKYLRTNDGFITLPYNETEWGKLPQEQIGGLSYEKWFEIATSGLKVIDQADTLDKLCDEFRYEFTKDIKHKRCFYIRKAKKWYDFDSGFELSEKEIPTIRGGIWNDKGFIYMVKISNDGGFELI